MGGGVFWLEEVEDECAEAEQGDIALKKKNKQDKVKSGSPSSIAKEEFSAAEKNRSGHLLTKAGIKWLKELSSSFAPSAMSRLVLKGRGIRPTPHEEPYTKYYLQFTKFMSPCMPRPWPCAAQNNWGTVDAMVGMVV